MTEPNQETTTGGLAGKVETYAAALARVLPQTVPIMNALREAGATDADCAALHRRLSERRASNMRYAC